MADNQLLINIDGKQVAAKPSQTILQAALDAGVYIPYLCYYPNMKPYGACRTCLVEIEIGGRKFIKASCTEPCADGMQVQVKSKEATELRRDIVELLMTEHPHGCLTCHRIELCGPQDVCQRHVAVTDRCTICPKNERCELKDTVRSVELDLKTPLQYHRRNLPIHADDPFYDRDYNLCIVCARCVRVCDEVRFDNAITLTNRSGVALVGTSHGISLMESGCEFCGACIDVCPTGALVERDYKWEKATSEVETVCTNCPVGCGMVAEVNKFNKVVRFKGNLKSTVNFGQACFKGKFGYDYPNSKHRIKQPFIYANGQKSNVSWDEAAEIAKNRLKQFKPNEIAVIVAPRATNEDIYAVRKFAHTVIKTPIVAFGSNNIQLLDTLFSQLGDYKSSRPIWDLEKSKTILVVGGNPTEEQNVLAVPLKRAARSGAKIIVVDSRETELTRYADEWIRPRPGTEALVISGMVKVVIDESIGNSEAVEVNGVDNSDLRQSLWQFDISKLSDDCGIDETALRQATRHIANSETASFVVGTDNLNQFQSVELGKGVVNLAILTNNISRDGTGLYPLYDGTNALGDKDISCISQHLRADGDILPPEHSEAVAELWGRALPTKTDEATLEQVLELMRSKKVKGALVFCDGINLGETNLAMLKESLTQLEFVATSALFESELTAASDLVLPAKTYAEQSGTITNLEGRIVPLKPLWESKAELRNGWETVKSLAGSFGAGGLDFNSSADVMKEIRKLLPAYAEINTEQLQAAGQIRKAIFAKDGKAQITTKPFEYDKIVSNGQNVKSDDTFILSTGRVLYQHNEPSTVAQKDGINYIERDEVAHIHPKDAKRLNLDNGSKVKLQTVDDGVFREIEAKLVLDSPHTKVIYATRLFAELASEMQDVLHDDKVSYLTKLDTRTVRVLKSD